MSLKIIGYQIAKSSLLYFNIRIKTDEIKIKVMHQHLIEASFGQTSSYRIEKIVKRHVKIFDKVFVFIDKILNVTFIIEKYKKFNCHPDAFIRMSLSSNI